MSSRSDSRGDVSPADATTRNSRAGATWLVTGAAGFIGSNLVRLILGERGDVRVVGFDKLTYAGHLASLEGLPEDRFTFVQGDIASAADVRKAFRTHRPDAVFHLAAESHVDRSIEDAGIFLETNVRGTFELLEAAREHFAGEQGAGVRFVHVSTDEVYGTLGPEDPRFHEGTPFAPNSPYAASKAGADLMVRAYHQTYGVPVVTTHCSNNYGPRQLPEKLIPLLTLNALAGKPLPIYGDGGQIRDWIHVEDHCRGLLYALERGAPGETYVFGGESERTNLEVVDAICDALERLRPIASESALREAGIERYADLRTFVDDRPGHDRRYAVDASKARAELGWAARAEFESALADTIAWYLENDAWRAAVESRGSHRERRGLPGGVVRGSAGARAGSGGR